MGKATQILSRFFAVREEIVIVMNFLRSSFLPFVSAREKV